MSDAIRYDHAGMADHVAAQGNLVQYMTDLRQQALNVLAQTADFWTEQGANAYQDAHRSIDLAYQQVFETVGRHATAIGQASHTAGTTDAGVASGFAGI